MPSEDFDRLKLLFRRTCTLPQLPGTALRLISTIDTGEASAIDLEKIIVSDPGLAAGFLRAAHAACHGEREYTTIRQAIMYMGQRAVRSLSTSLALQGMLTNPDARVPFNAQTFSRHSIFVGFLSRYVFARRQMREPFPSAWTADEIFAAGVLHDLGLGLLPRVAPEVYGRVANYSRRAGLTLNGAFERIYGDHISVLSAAAAETWQLPEVFTLTLRHRSKPWGMMEEYPALCCIEYANFLADSHGFAVAEWPVKVEQNPEIELEVALPEEEVGTVIELVAEMAEAYLPENLKAA